MKNKIILIAFLITMLLNRLTAQVFKEGDISLSAAYGFPNSIGLIHSSGFIFPVSGLNIDYYKQWDGYKSSTLGPLYANFEKGINERLALGFSIVYASRKIDYRFSNGAGADTIDYNFKFNASTLEVFFTVTKHFGNFERFDPYYRAGLGYRKGFYTASSDGPYQNTSTFKVFPLGFLFTIGAQYYIIENLGVFAEIGYASTLLLTGIKIRI